jgi:hypothetical protein
MKYNERSRPVDLGFYHYTYSTWKVFFYYGNSIILQIDHQQQSGNS